MSRSDGSGQVRVSRDGRRGSFYYSPSIADDGTIVALKGVFLHSFRPNGRRIVRPLQWMINPSRAISTEPFSVDLSPNGRIVATENAIYSTFYDPRTSQDRPEVAAQFVDFTDFRPNKVIGMTDGYYDYGIPSWIDSRRVLVTSLGIFNAQVLVARVGARTRGRDFFRDPNRNQAAGGTNAFFLRDAEMTRARDKWAAVRRPVLGADIRDARVGTIQVYRTGNPSTASTPLCRVGPRRRISFDADPSWSPDGRTLFWFERRGIYSTRVTSTCGRPKLVVRGAVRPDLSRANVPRRRR